MNASSIISFLRSRTMLQWLLVITVLYLIWQISLSGAILTASSIEASDRLSSLARKTVGFGMALFVFRCGYARLRWFVILPFALAMGWGAMALEDTVVEYFADRCSAQARLEAKTIQLFNTALSRGSARLPDVSEAIIGDHARSRAFAKILGFAIWNNPALVAELNGQLGAIINALYGADAYRKVDEAYDQYAQAFSKASQQLAQAKALLARVNYAQYARDLNRVLGEYAACDTDGCRQKLSALVAEYMRRKMPGLDLELDLDAFCQDVAQPERYVLGRSVGARSERVCSTNEAALRAWANSQFEAKKKAALPSLDDCAPAIRKRILSGDFLTLEAWRDMWKQEISRQIERRRLEEFGSPDQYGPGGAREKEGRAFAISIFLPPVALGFSITVCFLHLANVCAALTRRPLLCGIAAGICCFLPALLATPVPLTGFAGLYGRWLVFWEGWLYPFGLFRRFLL